MQNPINADDLDLVTELTWLLAEFQGKVEGRAAILQGVADLLKADYVASFVWDESRKQSIRPYALNIDQRWIQEYQRHIHEIDLVTPTMRAIASPARVDHHIPRAILTRSEFYNDFLRPIGMEYGLNVFFFDGQRDIGDLRVWRSRVSQPFTAREELLLSRLQPYFVRSLSPVSTGVGRLSFRENQVAELVAQGASDKEVARLLGIGFTTVRTHLSNVMVKLQCQNRTQVAMVMKGS